MTGITQSNGIIQALIAIPKHLSVAASVRIYVHKIFSRYLNFLPRNNKKATDSDRKFNECQDFFRNGLSIICKLMGAFCY